MNLGRKILIVGPNGSGKTTFGKKLSGKLNIPLYELDSISWLDNWEEMPGDEFKGKIKEISELSEWIIDGNYKKTIDLRLKNADSIIWLDYKIFKVLYRISKRTLKNLFTQEILWKNNRQTFGKVFHPKYSIIIYSLKTYKSKSNFLLQKMKSNEYKSLNWNRITNKKEEMKFWKNLPDYKSLLNG